MKIICDCGLESEFIIQDYNVPIEEVEEDGYYALLVGNVDIVAEHDRAWISCGCGQKVWIFA
jgi:hypothetical protein